MQSDTKLTIIFYMQYCISQVKTSIVPDCAIFKEGISCNIVVLKTKKTIITFSLNTIREKKD